jgi:hypothetical protein
MTMSPTMIQERPRVWEYSTPPSPFVLGCAWTLTEFIPRARPSPATPFSSAAQVARRPGLGASQTQKSIQTPRTWLRHPQD